MSTADTLPSLEKLGIKDRRIAWRAIQVARVDEDLFQRYLMTDEPTEKGLLRQAFYESGPREAPLDGEARGVENYSESETANLVPFDPDFGEVQSRRFTRGGYLGLATTGSEEWYTPSPIFEALGCRFDLDVASPGADVVWWIPADRHFTIRENGLKRDWGDAFVWMNHPYSPEMTPSWTEKFRQHGNGICLIGDRTSVWWWQDLCGNADLILFVNKKINFISPTRGPGNNTLGSTLVAYGERAAQALRNAAAAGLGNMFRPCQREWVDIVHPYVEAVDTAQPDDVDDHDNPIALPDSIDAYMTKPETASRLYGVALTKLAEDGCFTKEEMDALWFVEPSAGTGNFFEEMPKDRRIGIDINPLAEGIMKADFLSYELPLDPSIRWGILGNGPFSKGLPLKFINRAAQLGASFFALILPHTILRPSMKNKIDPYFECIHHEVLPENSFLRDGQVKYSPSIFQVWVRRNTPREPIIEQTVHPDWEWLPRKRMAEATAWMQNYGQGVGDIKASDNLGRTNSPDWHWFIRCEPDVLARLKAIDWRKIALPTASTPTLTKGDVVRTYIEATRRALTTQPVAEPDSSWEPIGPFLRYGLDVEPDQPANSVIPSTSPEYEESRKSTVRGVPSDEWVSWWAQRVEQFKRVLRPDGALIANIKEAVVDDQRSNYVLEFMLTMRPMQTGPHNILFISGCCTSIA